MAYKAVLTCGKPIYTHVHLCTSIHCSLYTYLTLARTVCENLYFQYVFLEVRRPTGKVKAGAEIITKHDSLISERKNAKNVEMVCELSKCTPLWLFCVLKIVNRPISTGFKLTV